MTPLDLTRRKFIGNCCAAVGATGILSALAQLRVIGAVAADAETAGGLGLDPGAACLALGRWTWRAGAGVTFARQVFPAGVLELTARFVPRAFD